MKKRLKVLHWPTSYPDPQHAPYHLIFIEEHVRAASLYHDNVVLFLSPYPLRAHGYLKIDRHHNNDFDVVQVNKKQLQFSPANRVLTYLGVFWAVVELLKSGFRPDIIHAHIFAEARIAGVLARSFRIPLVVTEHWSALCRQNALPSKRRQRAKKIYEQAAIVLPVCDYLRRCIVENTGAKFRHEIVLNAVDTSNFYPNCDSHFSVAKSYRLLSVARLEEAKGIPFLLQAVALLSASGLEIHLDLVGDGAKREIYEAQTQELGLSLNVTFHGQKPKSEIAHMMRQSDLFVLASLWENSPCVIGEALCCGLPVVATHVGGVPELIPPGAGLLVPPSDPRALSDGIKTAIASLSQYDRLGIADTARAKFSYEAIGGQLDEIYRALVRI